MDMPYHTENKRNHAFDIANAKDCQETRRNNTTG